jgi:hypothetical protein
MGLFSSKKKTTVHTSVMRIVDDDHLPQTMKTSVLRGILGTVGSVSEHLVDGLLNSAATKVDRMYRFAKDSSPYGLPHGSLITDIQGQDIVKTFLARQAGGSIVMDYYHFAPINNMHVAWQKLADDYGYFAGTNELALLSAQKGVPVYLQDMISYYCNETVAEAQPGTLDSFGRPATAGYAPDREAQIRFGLDQFLQVTDYQYDPASSVDYVQATYVYWLGGVKHTEMLYLSMAGYDYEGDYYQVQYRRESEMGRARFFTYRNESGVYPELDKIFKIDYGALGSYFPWTYCRFGKQNQGAEYLHSTPAYKNTVKMCDFLDLDYQDLCDNVDKNPDIDDIEQAMLMFAVPANADSQVEKRYLFEYFNALYYADTVPAQSIADMEKGLTDYSFKNGRSILIQDKLFKVTFGYSGLLKRKVAGKIGAVGTFDSGIGTTQPSGPIPIAAGYQFYRCQVSSVFYEEVQIVQPRMTYHIYGQYTYTAGLGNDELLIPLDRAITDLVPMNQREDLFLRSLHMVFNSRIVTKTKWYQTKAFQVVMVVIAVVIAIATGGAGSFLSALATAAAAGVSTLAITVVTMLLQTYLASYAFSLIAKELGPEYAMVLAIGAAIYGGMSAYEAGSFGASTTAQTMLKASTGLVKASSEEYQHQLRTEYNADLSEFQLFVDEATKELNEAKKLLDVGNLINPFEFIGEIPLLSLGEEPDTYFKRTIHAGNIGAVGIDAVSSYVDMSLKLPDMNQTMGELNNV